MNKTILITGGAKRLGARLAMFLAKEKYNIAITYNNSFTSAIKLKEKIESLNLNCQIYKFDFNDLDFIDDLVNKVSNDFNGIFGLINNASIFEQSLYLETTKSELLRNFNIHVFAPFLLSQAFAKISEKGKIINITDLRVKTETLRFFPYLLSKKSLADLTKMLAKDLAPKIQVNEIRPGILLPNFKYDPREDLNNEYTKHQKIEDFFSIVKDILDNNYSGRQIEIN
ncbi:MAG: SDR family NAD(P)-dependent oxidoreductase [Rickettsiales bacterium]|nr:SDR family NAD(P)-dependent oxidoreductase [Rickettsiales bacterium]